MVSVQVVSGAMLIAVSADLAQINSKDIPLISGIREKYNVNESINVNCSTTTRADLSWYMNGQKVG